MNALVTIDATKSVAFPPIGLEAYDAACTALAKAYQLDEVKDILDAAERMRLLAKQAGRPEVAAYAVAIAIKAERALGELMEARRKTGALKSGRPKNGIEAIPLQKLGIDKNLAIRARKAAAMPTEKYGNKLKRQLELAEKASSIHGRPWDGKPEYTGKFEWYTPAAHLALVREAMGGIDLDPASSDVAQKNVKAQRYYTISNDGLKQHWSGRVFLNPPYKQPSIEHFVDKLIEEFEAGRTKEAILLTHNYTDTEWFHSALRVCSAICLVKGRLKFIDQDDNVAGPRCGQVFFYFGKRPATFHKVFSTIGVVMLP